MPDRITVETIRTKFAALRPFLDDRPRRVWAATEALALGRGGVSAVAAATGLGRTTVRAGLRDLAAGTPTPPAALTPALPPRRVRPPGGGRPPLAQRDPTLVRDLEALIEPVTRGDPLSPLRWTCKSTRQLAAALVRQGHRVSHQPVAGLLHALHDSVQGNRTTKEGATHPDRTAQCEHINAQTHACQGRGQPVISVDTTKTALVGDFKNGGREWRPAGQPDLVRVPDCVDRTLGQAIPSGVDDLATNHGWVSVGTDHDTAAFAVQTVRTWWEQLGQPTYPLATALLSTAAGGGRTGRRARLWTTAVQRLADDTGLRITVSHFPQAPARGTQSSTEWSVTSPSTGAAGRWSVAR